MKTEAPRNAVTCLRHHWLELAFERGLLTLTHSHLVYIHKHTYVYTCFHVYVCMHTHSDVGSGVIVVKGEVYNEAEEQAQAAQVLLQVYVT